jgi:beta-mannosidase
MADDVVPDVLTGATWDCVSAPAGSRSGPDDLEGTDLLWMPAVVPGTVGEALRQVGASEPPLERMDGRDWWYRTRFAVPEGTAAPGGWLLEVDGLATLADVWLNGRHVLRSESMFARSQVRIPAVGPDNELCIRFAALTPVLEQRRPRPRWKAKGVSSQNLRWLRTTLLGRQSGWTAIPAPVGPWRPVRLRPVRGLEVGRRRIRATCATAADGTTVGTVTVTLDVSGPALAPDGPPTGEVTVGGVTVPFAAVATDGGWQLSGSVRVPDVERWWPHTHGPRPLYPVRAEVAGESWELGPVGFRSIVADRSDGGFGLVVNDVPFFCRGAAWYPVDAVSLQMTDEELDRMIDLVGRAGMNMLRIPGGTVYEDERLFAACDRAGILIWQDAMLGPVDPPDDPAYVASVVAEVSELLDRTAGHPSLAVLCGGQEIEEQAAMFGLSRDRWETPVVHQALPALVDQVAGGLVYVTSSPSGGDLPIQADAGVTHYFGVGVYLYPLEDLRRAAPRFVSEGLAFAMPPERVTVDEEFGGGLSAHHAAEWKLAVHRDAGSWFDLEDTRNHYTNSLFGVDVTDLWRIDHERALDLGRAAMAEIMTAAVAEWRRQDSPCNGMISIALRDLRPGPGWGLVDSSGRPKAPWFAMARGSAPIAVLATDEGINGLALHLVNDTAEPVRATLEVSLHTAAHAVESASCPVVVGARSGSVVRAEGLFDGFRDLTYAYCFGPRGYELITASLVDASGTVLADTSFLPGGPARAVDPDVGLQGTLERSDDEVWLLRVSSRRFAQYVQIDFPGFAASDSWFHLPPGGTRTVVLRPEGAPGREPKGRVRSLNSTVQAVVSP